MTRWNNITFCEGHTGIGIDTAHFMPMANLQLMNLVRMYISTSNYCRTSSALHGLYFHECEIFPEIITMLYTNVLV